MNPSLRSPSNCRIAAPDSLWEKLCAVIRTRVSPDSFDRWFSNVSLLSVTPEAVTLGVPNPIHQFFIESNYSDLLSSSLAELLGDSCSLLLTCTQEPAEDPQEVAPQVPAPVSPRALSRPAPVATGGMNPSYTFGSFIVGANNQFAHAAAQAVAMAVEGGIVTREGKRIPTEIHSMCLHGDEPTAQAVGGAARQALIAAGVVLKGLPDMAL